MARESTITYEQVAQAANTLKANGNKATSRAVREALGTGSMATICKHLTQWASGQTVQTAAIDDSIDPSISRAISNQLALRIQEATAIQTAALADIQAENAMLIAEGERQADQIKYTEESNATLAKQGAGLVGRIEQLQAEAERHEDAIKQERQTAEAARVELAKTLLRLESLPRIETELAQVRADLEAERIKSAKLHEEAAIATALLAQTEKTATEATARALKTEQALFAERVTVNATTARLEAAAREITTAQDTATKAREQATKALEEAAELRGKLAELEKQKSSPPAPKASAKLKP